MKVLGWITVPNPIDADGAIEAVEAWKGLKCFVNVLKSLKGSSEINNALEKAKDNYGTFWRDAVGGYRVDFPKPKEEKKPEEKVADPAIENKENKKE